jgi:hypothetical protein
MAFAADSFSINRMARLVGTMTNSMCRRFASRFTSFNPREIHATAR